MLGVGIVGVTALKFTNATTVTLSDYRDDVLKNAEKNITFWFRTNEKREQNS